MPNNHEEVCGIDLTPEVNGFAQEAMIARLKSTIDELNDEIRCLVDRIYELEKERNHNEWVSDSKNHPKDEYA